MILADELLPKGGELQEPTLSLRVLDAAKGRRGTTRYIFTSFVETMQPNNSQVIRSWAEACAPARYEEDVARVVLLQ